MQKDNEHLRIAMLGHKRVPSREGGIEVVVGELSTRMVSRGHQVTCYNRRGYHVSGKEFSEEWGDDYQGVKLKNVFTINRRGWAALTASVTAAFFVAVGKYDIVHFHAEGPCAMIWLPKLMGKKCVATIHGLDHMRAKWGTLPRAYIMAGERMAVKCADEIIVLSESAKTYFEETYGRKTRLIPNGIQPPSFRKAQLIRDQFSLEENEYILFVGRLTPEKGIQYLIEAYKKLRTEKKLVIAGGTSDTERYAKELRKMAVGERQILFTGFVQGRLLEELYSNAYVFVQPSDLEGMSLCLLEAMSYGNCCLVSDIPECADVIEQNGVQFARGNVEDLAEKLQYLCDTPETVRQYKERSPAFILEKYNWDAVVEQTLELYRRSGKKR